MKLFRAGIRTTRRRFSANCKITRSAAGHLVHHQRDTCAKRLRLGVSLRIYCDATTTWHCECCAACHGASSPGEARGSNFLICIYLELDRGQSTTSARGLLNALAASEHTKYHRARVVSPTNNPGALTLNVLQTTWRAPCEMHDVFNNSSSV